MEIKKKYKNNPKKKILLILGVLILLIGIFYIVAFGVSFLTGKIISEDKSEIDLFAECLTNKNIKLYIRGGDSYCDSQKNEFGSSSKYLNIIDCANEPALCQEAGVQGIPAWVIDGKVYYGNKNLEQISQISKCPLN
ncbi:MAG: hypothetical protein Q8N63_07425 [Nanoarchaeota archaeon]|nr:hypothetical protein [Nanoarchaeota archaeon]